MNTVRFHTLDPNGTLRWRLVDPRRLSTTALYDHLWLRLLDVGRALEARTYRREGRLTLHIRGVDDERRMSLVVRDGLATCDAAGPGSDRDEADLTLDLAALGSLYLGTVELPTLVAAGRVIARDGVDLEAAGRLLGTDGAPFCSTHF